MWSRNTRYVWSSKRWRRLTALPGNGTVGLDWARVPAARKYRVYWSTSAGVDAAAGDAAELMGASERARSSNSRRRISCGSSIHQPMLAPVAWTGDLREALADLEASPLDPRCSGVGDNPAIRCRQITPPGP